MLSPSYSTVPLKKNTADSFHFSSASTSAQTFGDSHETVNSNPFKNPLYYAVFAVLLSSFALFKGGFSSSDNELPSENIALVETPKRVNVAPERFPSNIGEHLNLPSETIERAGSVYNISQKHGVSVEQLEQFNGINSRSVHKNTPIFLPYIEFKVGSFSDGTGNLTKVGHLNGISRIVNVSPRAIAASNNMDMSQPLSVGQKLRIPIKSLPEGSEEADDELTLLLFDLFPDLKERNISFASTSSGAVISGSADDTQVNGIDMSGLDEALEEGQRLFELDPRLGGEGKKKRRQQ
jgi:hypothetical protein